MQLVNNTTIKGEGAGRGSDSPLILDNIYSKSELENCTAIYNGIAFYKSYMIKCIKSGKLKEFYLYQYPVFLQRPEYKKNDFSHRRKHNLKWSKLRAFRIIRRAIFNDFEINDKFLTLTFHRNINDLDYCYKELKLFLRELKILFDYTWVNGEPLKYIIVPEYQKRGAVHYHLIINLPFITKEIQNVIFPIIWRHGFKDLRAIKDLNRASWYLAKYITKSELPIGRKRYYKSKNLSKSKIIYNYQALNELKNTKIDTIYTINKYKSDMNGIVNVYTFIEGG
jgi:hypothetical protein